jgi:hypothetical protein
MFNGGLGGIPRLVTWQEVIVHRMCKLMWISSIRAFATRARSDSQHDAVILQSVAEQLFARCGALSQESRDHPGFR